MGSVTDAAFEYRRPQGLPSPLSCFSLGDVAFAATTSKLDKDLQDDKERYPTRHHDKKCDMACLLRVVRHLMKILVDTNVLPAEEMISLLKNEGHEVLIARATAYRELEGTDLKEKIKELTTAEELFIFGESTFPMRFAESTNRLAKILSIISTNSFPKDTSNLTRNQINQFRDAMIFESALIEGCNIICSNDGRAFFNHGKQELLEQQFNIKLYKPCELLGAVNA